MRRVERSLVLKFKCTSSYTTGTPVSSDLSVSAEWLVRCLKKVECKIRVYFISEDFDMDKDG